MGRRRKATTATTTTTTASTAGTYISPTPIAPVPSQTSTPKLRGEALGISAGPFASIEVLDACVDLGVKWVRVSHESGWPGTILQLAGTVQEAHARGLKVLQVVQTAGKDYSDPVKNTALAQFAKNCIETALVDALEVGNEWNHPQFWLAPPASTMPPLAQAQLSIAVAQSARSSYRRVPVVTNGMSPEADPLNPWKWWPQFLSADLSGHWSVVWDGIGLHPYCYPELATTNPIQWNPLPASATILNDAKTRGVIAPVWLTEMGAPGFATNAPVVRGVALTEQRQADCYRAYFEVMRSQEATGIRYPLAAFATMFDGQSATNAVEQGLGLRRADRTKKPAWTVVRDFALEPLPA